MADVEAYRTLRIPIPEGAVALIFPEALTLETAVMLLEIFAAQFARYRKETSQASALESVRGTEGEQP